MPKLIRLYITQVAWGFVISAVFVGVLLAFNVANLRHLITTSEIGLIALVMIWFMNGIVFAGVQFAYAIMSMAEKSSKNSGGGSAVLHSVPVPVAVVKKQR